MHLCHAMMILHHGAVTLHNAVEARCRETVRSRMTYKSLRTYGLFHMVSSAAIKQHSPVKVLLLVSTHARGQFTCTDDYGMLIACAALWHDG